MSIEEMKKNIIEKVEMLTEEQLVQLTKYVDAINQETAREYDLFPHVENIVKERGDVLKKLAQ